MKNIIICIACIVIIIISVFFTKYLDYKKEYNEIKQNNLEYESYLNKTVYGTEIATVVNKAVDNNEKNSVPKNEKGLYIDNEENSMRVEVKIIDNNTTYQMETLYNGGMDNFAYYYNSVIFECTNIKYNKKGKVSYILFKQKTT